jgi:GT2 family glycosyltransferase
VNAVAVVLSWNGREDTLAALESLEREGLPAVCVDNGSTDGSPEAVEERFPAVELIRTGVNLGYTGGNNVGIRRALDRGADWVLLVNNDAVVEPGLTAALEEAVRLRPDAGVLACKVTFFDPPDLIWFGGARFDTLLGYHGRQAGYGKPDPDPGAPPRDTGRATGAGMAVSRAAIERAGLLDERLFAYVEDAEWSLRIRSAGFEVVYVPRAVVRHKVSASTGGTASITNLYYDTRNTIAVCEWHRPLPRGLRSLRRGVIVGAHLAQAVRHPRRRVAVEVVLRAWRDARRGRLGRVALPA